MSSRREVLVFPTHEAAVAEALRGAPPGEVIEIHEGHCQGREDEDGNWASPCTCTPLVHIASAATA